jgi:hypothetical protein
VARRAPGWDCSPHATAGATSRVADSALASADNLQKLAEPQLQWLPRGPAMGRAAPAVLAQPDPLGSPSPGALAARRTARRARMAQQRCLSRAPPAWAEAPWPAPAVRDGAQGQTKAARGFGFLKAPPFLAASLYLKNPARVMALLRVRTGWWLVSAA